MHKRIIIIILLIASIAIIMTSVIVASTQIKSNTSKANIIATFNENKNRFENIQSYAMSLKDNIYIYLDGKEIVYDENQKESITANNIEKDIEYVLLKLQYNGIYGDNGNIKFVKNGSENETGIYYIKDNVKPENTPSGGYYERIVKNWFYYYENPT